VIRALKDLTREGFAQTFTFNGPEPYLVEFHPGKVRDLWFYPTKRGMKAVNQFPGKD
jgi:hypothetical protein